MSMKAVVKDAGNVDSDIHLHLVYICCPASAIFRKHREEVREKTVYIRTHGCEGLRWREEDVEGET